MVDLSPETIRVVTDLKERMERAVVSMDRMADELPPPSPTAQRLRAKTTGVELALSYVEELLR